MAFEEVIRLSLADVRPPELQRVHAEIARAGLAEFLAGQSPKPPVERFVDGRRGAVEESVKAYGVIRYEFSYAREVVEFALATARALSPVDDGDFKAAWFAMVDGRQIAPAALPAFPLEVTITNDRPYARKIEVGAMKMSVPPGIVEATRQRVNRQFRGVVRADVRFIELAGGYVLRRHGKRRTARAGQRITYPALVLTFG